MLRQRKAAVERQNARIQRSVRKPAVHPLDFRLPGEKHQHAAIPLRQRVPYGTCHGGVDRLGEGKTGAVFDLDRVLSTARLQHAGIAQQVCHRHALQGGRHHRDGQRIVLAKQFTTLQRKRQAQFRVEIALMKLVEDQQTHTAQPGVALQPSGEHTLGNHFDAGVGADPTLEAHAIPHLFTHCLAQQVCHARRCRTSGHPAWLHQQNGSPRQPCVCEEGQGYQRGLARTRGSLQHHITTRSQRLTQRWQYVGNGQ